MTCQDARRRTGRPSWRWVCNGNCKGASRRVAKRRVEAEVSWNCQARHSPRSGSDIHSRKEPENTRPPLEPYVADPVSSNERRGIGARGASGAQIALPDRHGVDFSPPLDGESRSGAGTGLRYGRSWIRKNAAWQAEVDLNSCDFSYERTPTLIPLDRSNAPEAGFPGAPLRYAPATPVPSIDGMSGRPSTSPRPAWAS